MSENNYFGTLKNLKEAGDPIVYLMRERIESRGLADPPTIDMTQALVAEKPPLTSQDIDLLDPTIHRLGPMPGNRELRQRIADYRTAAFDTPIDADNVIVTAGANQAFALAMLALILPQRQVLLPSPYFFNHAMAIASCGAKWIEVPVDIPTFQPDFSRLDSTWPEGCGVIVVTDPSNPTGMTLTPSSRFQLHKIVHDRRAVLILDETYFEFRYDLCAENPPIPLDRTVLIGSFSKSLSLSGWRVGYLIAAAPLVKQLMKIQDSIMIAAPTAAQVLALRALDRRTDHFKTMLPKLRAIRDQLTSALNENPLFSAIYGESAVFIWTKLADGRLSSAGVDYLMDHLGVATLPGDSFGQSGSGYLRFAYGTITGDQIKDLSRRLRSGSKSSD